MQTSLLVLLLLSWILPSIVNIPIEPEDCSTVKVLGCICHVNMSWVAICKLTFLSLDSKMWMDKCHPPTSRPLLAQYQNWSPLAVRRWVIKIFLDYYSSSWLSWDQGCNQGGAVRIIMYSSHQTHELHELLELPLPTVCYET